MKLFNRKHHFGADAPLHRSGCQLTGWRLHAVVLARLTAPCALLPAVGGDCAFDSELCSDRTINTIIYVGNAT